MRLHFWHKHFFRSSSPWGLNIKEFSSSPFRMWIWILPAVTPGPRHFSLHDLHSIRVPHQLIVHLWRTSMSRETPALIHRCLMLQPLQSCKSDFCFCDTDDIRTCHKAHQPSETSSSPRTSCCKNPRAALSAGVSGLVSGSFRTHLQVVFSLNPWSVFVLLWFWWSSGVVLHLLTCYQEQTLAAVLFVCLKEDCFRLACDGAALTPRPSSRCKSSSWASGSRSPSEAAALSSLSQALRLSSKDSDRESVDSAALQISELC